MEPRVNSAFSLARLSENLHGLLEARDFQGAEELLLSVLGGQPGHAAYLHFQLGRMYSRWGKLSSAVNHLGKATELAADNEILLLEITQEFRQARDRQARQAP